MSDESDEELLLRYANLYDDFYKDYFRLFRAALGAEIKKAREARGVSLEELARSTGNFKDIIASIENGEERHIPAFSWLVLVSMRLNVPLSEMMKEAEKAVQGG